MDFKSDGAESLAVPLIDECRMHDRMPSDQAIMGVIDSPEQPLLFFAS